MCAARALLFGGMKESREKEVTLTGAAVEPFRVLLQYIYTGQMSLASLKVASAGTCRNRGQNVCCSWDTCDPDMVFN